MSSASAQAHKFYEEVARSRSLWFMENTSGTALEFDLNDGKVSFPLWSSESRIKRLEKLNPALLGAFRPRQISWSALIEVLVPLLQNKQRVVGVNLSGPRLSGFDMPVEMLVRNVETLVRAYGA
jgi:hypothetical protein